MLPEQRELWVQASSDFARVPPPFKEALGVSVISLTKRLLADILVLSLKTETGGRGIFVFFSGCITRKRNDIVKVKEK